MRIIPALAALVAAISFTGPTVAQQGPTLAPPKLHAPTVQTPVSAPQPVSQLTQQDVATWMDGFVPYALARGDVAGAVVVVVKDGQVLFQKGYGYADVKTRKPVDPATTLFRPGSVSKLFTWTAVMQLVEQHKLNLDQDVNTYLDFKIPPYQGKPITLRNIMTHSAGFEEAAKNVLITKIGDVQPLDKYVKASLPARVYPVGEVPAYSNYATAVAGYIIQRVSGQTYDDYIEQHIFNPLGMKYASFRQPLPDALKPYAASGYKLGSGPASPYEYIGPAPAGSSAISGGDMARFMIAHLQDGQYGSARILQPQTAEMMHNTAYTVVSPQLHRMLLGFYEQDRNGHKIIEHAGDTNVFHTDLMLLPNDHLGVFISMNSLGKDGAAGGIREALFDGFVDRYLPGPGLTGSVAPATARQHAAMMAGGYDNSRRMVTNFMSLLDLIGQMKVSVDKDGHLVTSGFKTAGGAAKKFVEVQPFVWRDVDGKERLAAKVENGKVVMFSEDEISPFMVFQPTPAARNPAWLMPVLIASLAALFLNVVLWPVAAIARRRYGHKFALEGMPARSYRWVRIASGLALALTLTWLATVVIMLETFAVTSAMDPWITILHLLSIIIFPVALVIGAWNLWVVWSNNRSWFAKLWSVVLLLALFFTFYVGLMFHLIGWGVKF